MKILSIDIETTPMITYSWGLWNQNIGINQIQVPSRMFCFAARWIDQPKNSVMFYSDFHHGHEYMVQAVWDLLDEADAIETWNGKQFDEKRIHKEFAIYDLGSPSPVYHIDLMKETKRCLGFESNKLDWVAQQLGLGGKLGHSGMQLWIDCMADDPAAWRKMQRYNEQDVHLLVGIHGRLLPWLRLPNQNLYEVLGGCPTPHCPGTPHKRGFRPTQTGLYQRYYCPECRRWSSSGKAIERSDLRGE